MTAWLWLGLVAVTAPPWPQGTTKIGTHQVTPARGRRPAIVVARRPGPRAALRIQFAVGALDDGIAAGLTRLAQHVLLSANRRGRYATLLERLHAADASIAVETGHARCAFVLEAPAPDFDALAEDLLARIFAPSLARRGLNEARQRLFHETPSFNTTALATMFSQATLGDHGFSVDPLGDRDSMRSLAMFEVQSHIRKFFRPANATVILTGRFDAARLKRAALRYTGGRRQAPRGSPPLESGVYQLRARFEVHLVGLPVPLGTDEAAAVMRIAAAMLGERIQEDFRRMGAVYSTSVVPIRRPWLDFVLLILPTHESTTSVIEAEIHERISDLSDPKYMSDQRFERYRQVVVHRLRQIDRSPPALAAALAMAESKVPWFGPKVTRAVLDLDGPTFRERVAAWARPNKTAYVLLAPKLKNRRRAQ